VWRQADRIKLVLTVSSRKKTTIVTNRLLVDSKHASQGQGRNAHQAEFP
jgi:hypothetical protein